MRTRYLETGERTACCGCQACKMICPTKAIKFEMNSDGFNYPVLNSTKCINCGKCKNACPMEKFKKINPINVYAAINKNKVDLEESSSGGVFRALAFHILEENGVVVGAVLKENKVYHEIAEDFEKVKLMSGSKYVQSEISAEVYEDIHKILKLGKKVLFTGTPCQCMAIKNIYGKYSNLITMDFVCHGVPSPVIFDDYIEYLKEREKCGIQYISFRYKDKKRMGKYEVYKTDTGKMVVNPFYKSYYLAAFEKGLLTRMSCFECPYSCGERASDITVCDYWGVEKYHSEIDAIKGVSALIINTEAGEHILKKIQNYLYIVPSRLENVQNENTNLVRATPKPEIYDEFFEKRKSLPLKK